MFQWISDYHSQGISESVVVHTNSSPQKCNSRLLCLLHWRLRPLALRMSSPRQSGFHQKFWPSIWLATEDVQETMLQIIYLFGRFLPGNWRSAFVQNGEDVRNCRRLPRSESRRPDLAANRCSSWKNKICFIAASSRIRWVSSFHLSPRSAGCKCHEKSFTTSDCALIFMEFEPFSSILLYDSCRGETF